VRLLYKYFIKELILPFIFSLLIITFILFVNFLLRAIDRFLGKGLDFIVIFEYLFLNLAWILALSVPMAVLLATLMTFGRLSEDNEINAIKASGIDFLTIMKAPIIFGTIITLILIYFNNFILPEMNFKARMLSGDIYRKRPDMNIEPGIFLDNLPSYSMIIGKKNKEGIMSDIRIFSKGNKEAQTSIHSNSGQLNTIRDAFLLTLYNGEIHELGQKDYTNYRRIIFQKHIINIPAKDLLLNRRDSTNRSDREMTVKMMLEKIDNYSKRVDIVYKRLSGKFFRTLGDSISPSTYEQGQKFLYTSIDSIKNDTSISDIELIKIEKIYKKLDRQMLNEFNLIENYNKSKNKYGVEIHKKFSIPIACILFVLLGAPLGVMSKKGGLAVSTSLSFGFFLIYYVLLISGEEMADRGFLTPAIGMWTPNFIILFIAIILIIYTAKEKTIIRIKIPSLFKKNKK
tara:strand:+ start:387 stop:1757 length:1371 start_codon:yes stop_codon:yes gene_type:complete